MSRSSFLYALWCMAVLGLYLFAASRGYSPFADGGRTAGAYRAYGPHHK